MPTINTAIAEVIQVVGPMSFVLRWQAQFGLPHLDFEFSLIGVIFSQIRRDRDC